MCKLLNKYSTKSYLAMYLTLISYTPPIPYPESSGLLVSGRSLGETLGILKFYGRNPAVIGC